MPARYPFLLPAAYVQRILKWLGQGEKEQKSSIEVGAGRVELLKKYDMIRTADWKREETRMQEESKEKSKDASFESLRILSERWKTERSRKSSMTGNGFWLQRAL